MINVGLINDGDKILNNHLMAALAYQGDPTIVLFCNCQGFELEHPN
jgi:hypothetical protein